MAKKSIENELKKKGKSIAKRSVKKGARKAMKTASDGIDNGQGKKGAPKRNIFMKLAPYCAVVAAVVLAVLMVTVRIVGSSAGVLGDFIEQMGGGLLGFGWILFPLTLGYLGVKWCIHNIRWRESDMSPKSESYDEYKRAKGRLVLGAIMSFLVILTVSALMGVFAGDDVSIGFDLRSIWYRGADSLLLGGGGVIGGAIGGLMVAAVKQVASVIILGALLIVFGLLTFGFTPDYVITKIKDASIAAAERRAERAAERLEEEKKAREEAEKAEKAAKAAKPADPSVTVSLKNEKEEKKAKEEKVKEQDSADAVLELLNEDQKKKEPEEDIVAKMFSDEPKKEPEENKSRENGGDFGGEEGFDAEFDTLDSILSGMNLDRKSVV